MAATRDTPDTVYLSAHSHLAKDRVMHRREDCPALQRSARIMEKDPTVLFDDTRQCRVCWHTKSHPDQSGTIQCEHCNAKYTQAHALLSHIGEEHQ